MELLDAGKQVLDKLNHSGFEAYFVGGMVRDRLLGLKLHDIDVTTSASPENVMALFEKCIPTGLAHGTVTVMVANLAVEVTTYRVDGAYDGHRHPLAVAYTASLEEDLRRRDFTINAMAMDAAGTILDPLQGAADLRGKMIRAVGNAQQRFMEDPLRMLRALRFVSKLGFFLDSGCRQAIENEGALVSRLSRERVMKEIDGLMAGFDRLRALELFKETGLLGHFSDLKPLERLEVQAFAPLKNGFDLFLAAAFFTDDLKAYLNAWPFTRFEKKMIRTLLSYWDEDVPLIWLKYKEGAEAVQTMQRMRLFFGRTPDGLPVGEPVIASRKELALSAAAILEAAGQPAGRMGGQLLEAVEKAVVLGQIKNEAHQILEFIGECYVSAKT